MRRVLPALVTAFVAVAAVASESSFPHMDSLYDYDGDLGSVGPFALTDQNGRGVTHDDLLGKVWVAHFFFTCCEQGCSTTTANMKELQQDLRGYPEVMLVSFTVDPEDDQPEVLRRWAADWQADPERWLFLTGAQDPMYELIQRKFRQAVGQNKEAPRGSKVIHSFSLMLVDQRGQIRGFVDGKDRTEVLRLGERVKRLALANYLPTINAGLNGTCAVLLALGYVAIRRRWVLSHKGIMLTALVVSAVFLACYVFYHAYVQNWRSTRFPVDGWPRTAYLSILLSHTLLAVVVAPLALFITFQGLRNRLASHVRVARWTLPLWLYVSITGVVVYWMLYHLYSPS